MHTFAPKALSLAWCAQRCGLAKQGHIRHDIGNFSGEYSDGSSRSACRKSCWDGRREEEGAREERRGEKEREKGVVVGRRA